MILSSIKNNKDWIDIINKFPEKLQDIYYHPDYINMNCLKNDSEGYMFVNQNNNEIWAYPFIKIKIPDFEINLKDKIYYDLETPYGYGGPISNSQNKKFIKESNDKFNQWMKKNNIIAEFFRFHPLLKNLDLVDNSIEIIENRKTCSIKLDNLEENDLFYTPKVNNMIRRAENSNLISFISKDKKDFLDFKKIYEDLMKLKNADKDLFFSDNYFEKLFQLIKKNGFLSVIKNDKSQFLAAAVFLFSKKMCHYHLSATNHKYNYPGINNLLIHKAALNAKNMKIDILHLGGGNTNLDKDSLFLFKESMSNLKHFFHIGKRINNIGVYKKIKEKWKKQNPELEKKYSYRLLCYHAR